MTPCPQCNRDRPDSDDSGLCAACLLGIVMTADEGPVADGETIEEQAYHLLGIEILGRIAEGGMGIIYEAHQEDLDRRIALKVLREEHRANPALTAHFVAEGQVGGRLQHPGIVPIYARGELVGRPFFSMRLIEGRSLADALAQPPDRGGLLEVFEKICQTVAYAHSRGVIHRDLKPGNVMLGDFGETLVVDWGMAITLPVDEKSSGSVAGTPAYMAPEQARGDADQDERCDIFGLGAILCEILTGHPPYVGDSDAEVRRKARSGETAEALARVEASGTEEALRRLVTSCLEADPRRRPRDAGAVASTLEAYRAGVLAQARAAEEGRLRAEVKAVEERRRWGLILALVAVCAGTAVWWTINRAEAGRREAEAGRSIVAALDEARSLREQGRSAEARAVFRRIEGQIAAAGPSLRSQFGPRLSDLEMLARLEDVRFLPGQAAPGRMLHVQAATAYEEAFRRHGIDVIALDAPEAASRVRSSAIRDALIAALDEWARSTPIADRKRRLRTVADAADPEPNGLAARIRKAIPNRDRATLGELARSAKIDSQSPTILVSLGAALLSEGATEESIALLRRARALYPGDFWINLALAAALAAGDPGESAEAKEYLTAALALSRGNPGAYFYFGSALHDRRRLIPAVDAYRRAIAARPDYAEAYCNLGNALTALGRLDDAVAAFNHAIESRPGYALAFYNLGCALDTQEKYDDAAAAYRRAIAFKPGYFEALCNLGLSEYRMGKFADACADIDRGRGLMPAGEGLASYMKDLSEMAHSLVPLEGKLDAVLKGAPMPTDVDAMVGLARLCAWRHRRLYDRATRIYQDAFAARPALADDFAVGDRYAAAESAAMAGCGLGDDASGLDDARRAECRALALTWLRADLAYRRTQVKSSDPRTSQEGRTRLRFWLKDRQLGGLREPEAIEKLADSERAGWRSLWAEVKELAGPPPPAPK